MTTHFNLPSLWSAILKEEDEVGKQNPNCLPDLLRRKSNTQIFFQAVRDWRMLFLDRVYGGTNMSFNPIYGCWRYVRRKMTSRLLFLFLLTFAAILFVMRSQAHITASIGWKHAGLELVNNLQEIPQARPYIPSADVVNASYYDIEQLHHDHVMRIKHLRQQCQGEQQKLFGLSPEKWAYGRIEIDRQDHYMYCPLLKVGSTFFRRVFYTMRAKQKLNNPYDVPIERALSAKTNILNEIMPLNSSSATEFLSNSTSIMFVREPFSRLLSGYIDKLFAPNPYFWAQVGRHVIFKFRTNATLKEMHCGSDVTFEEFVRYVIDSEVTNNTHRDAHFSPTYDQCKPCTLNYTVIGKMETFKTDVFYTLAQLGFNISKAKLSDWANDATVDAVMDSTRSPFRWESGIKKCMSWTQALKRIWRKLQIRGIILLEDKFPWTPEFSEQRVSIRLFTDTVKQLNSKSDKDKLTKQKIEVLAEAFGSVSQADLEKLVDIFQPDFNLFQYDSRPYFIFDESFVKEFRHRNLIFNLDTL